MASLELSLLGPFQANLNGLPITTFESIKVRALLAYLAVEVERPQRREALAGLLWPDWPQQAALRNLSYALADLRKNLGDRNVRPTFLLISRDTLQLNRQSDAHVDIWDFDQLITNQQSKIIHLKSTISLYRGPFLEGFSLPDSAPFEDWLGVMRDQVKRKMQQALSGLAETYAGQADYEQALPYARRQLELEPWLEEAHQQLMRLLALSGQRSAALAQYEACRKALKDGLGVEPGAETARLYEAIRDGTLETMGEKGASPAFLPPAPGAPPFKGLTYFDEADAGLFFGREALTARLVEHVAEMAGCHPEDEDQPGCTLAVVGASGSGKSSVVRAGLVPALKQGQHLPLGSPNWIIQVLTPTAFPLEALAASLTREVESVSAAATLSDDLARDPRSLNFFARKLLASSEEVAGYPGLGEKEIIQSGRRLLLVIDQFEELFTLCRSETEQAAFLDNLMNAARGGVLLVIALRADFYPHCARYPHLRQALSARQEYIGPMSASELRQAIEAPARLGGWEFAPGLVDLILRDVGASEEHPPEPGALPLLEHALLETWQRRSGKTLTLEGYAAAGGVQGAIAQTAESVFHRLDPGQQILARRIFMRLTELGEGTQDTRRRATLLELTPDPALLPQVESLLKELADARLITLAEGTVEVAHEALIREWPALRTWLSEDREGLRLHRRLTESAQEWGRMNRDPGELYRGARLAQSLEWKAQPGHQDELNTLEGEFLAASQAYAEQEAQEREAQRQTQLETAQKLVETEQVRATEQAHAARRLRQRARYLAGAALVAVMLAAAAVFIAFAADRNARLANARQFASAALAGLAIDPGQSLSQTLQSLQVQPSVEAYSALHQVLFANHLNSRLVAHHGDVYGIAVNPAGDRLATISLDQTLKVWRLQGGAIDPSPFLTIPIKALDPSQFTNNFLPLEPLQYSPDGKYLATVDYDTFSVDLLDAQTGKLIGNTGNTGDPFTGFTFSPDSRLIAAAVTPGISIWDLKSGDKLWQMDGNLPVFSPDGQHLASDSFVGAINAQVKLYNLIIQPAGVEAPSGSFEAPYPTIWTQEGENGIYSLRYSPNGQELAFTTLQAVHILDLTPMASGMPPRERLTIPLESQFVALYYLPGGDRLVTASRDGKISIWNTQNGQLLSRLLPDLPLSTAAVSPDGRTIFTAHPDGEVSSWDITSPGRAERLVAPTGGGASVGVILSRDGARLLGWNLRDISQRKWDFTWWRIDGDQVKQSGGYTIIPDKPILFYTDIYTTFSSGLLYDFGPARIAIGIRFERDWEVQVFNAVNGELVKNLGLLAGVSSFKLNSDGSQLFVGRPYGFVDVWEVATGHQLTSFRVSQDQAFDHPIYLNLSGDDSRLLTWGSSDPVVRLWDSTSHTLITDFGEAKGTVCEPVLTPDQRFLLTCGEDQTVMIWDATSGKLSRKIQLPDTPNLVQISPDQRYLVASLVSSQTAVFDFASGRELVTLQGSSSTIYSGNLIKYVNQERIPYQFSADGKVLLITIPSDGTAYGFVLDNNELVRLACQRLAQISLPENGKAAAELPICKTSPGKP